MSEALRRICHGDMPIIVSDNPFLADFGISKSSWNINHQFELMRSGARHSRYAFFSQKLSSSQLWGDALSRAANHHVCDEFRERTKENDEYPLSVSAGLHRSQFQTPLPIAPAVGTLSQKRKPPANRPATRTV